MSNAIFAEVKRLRAEVNQLMVDVRELRLRLYLLAGREPEPAIDPPKRRGRPPKVQQ
jgi:hypothetical protein